MNETQIEELRQQLNRIERQTSLASKNVLNIEEVAFMTGFKKATIYEMSSKNQIPHAKRGGRLFFCKEDIEDWLLEKRVATHDEMDRKAATYIAKRRI